MYKLLLLALALLSAAPAAHAQKTKRLRGQALLDSMSAAFKVQSDKRLVKLKHELDSVKTAREGRKAALDTKNGFRNYHFGDAISQHPELVKKEADGNQIYYTNPTESLKIGEADLKDVVIGFYKDKLSFILIRTIGQLNSTRAKDVLEAQYGPGFQGNKFLPEYAWFGNNVSLLYDENSVTHDAKIIFSEKAIAAQEAADKKAAAKKAASDL